MLHAIFNYAKQVTSGGYIYGHYQRILQRKVISAGAFSAIGQRIILACEKVCDLEKKLREEVGEEEYKKYEDLQKALAPVDFENQAQAFKVGFSIGSLFMYENLSIFSKLGKK